VTGCDVCGDINDRRLYGVVDGKRFCSRCWKRAGSPFPKLRSDPEEARLAELATRERMTKRGGPDRHLVRNNRT